MIAIDFMPYQEFLKISDKIKNKEDFEYEKRIKNFKIDFESGKAGCNFELGRTKEGDYLVTYGFNLLTGDYTGYGAPMERTEQLETFAEYKNIIQFVEKEINGHFKGLVKIADTDIDAEINSSGEQLRFF